MEEPISLTFNESTEMVYLPASTSAAPSAEGQPEAVAGPTPFRELSSAIAAFTSGRRRKAFVEHCSTASSLLEATSCCSRGLNFPL